MVPQFLSPLRASPGRGRTERPGELSTSHDRQRCQSVAAEAGQEPLRRSGDTGRVADGVDVDRECRAVCRELRRPAERRRSDAGRAVRRTRVPENAAIFPQRCGECHAIGQPQNETGRAIPFNPIDAGNPRGLESSALGWERVVLQNDPQTKYSPHILVNMTRPECSPLLLGPLAKSAGGWESCGPVFADTTDPAYQQLLGSLRRGKAEADVRPRYGTPGFRPNRQYIRELKRYGILASDFDPAHLANRHLRG